MSTLTQVLDQMQAAGLPLLPAGHPILDGSIKRFGKDKKCWYSMREIRLKSGEFRVVGAFGQWQGLDNNAVSIKVDWEGVSELERAEISKKQAEFEAAQKFKKQRAAANAANRARLQWQSALQTGESGYVSRKQITPFNARFFSDGTLLVPMVALDQNGAKTWRGLQKIDAAGNKKYSGGMDKLGALCLLGDKSDINDVIVIAEGYATACSIKMATNMQVAVAFDAGNVEHVSKSLRAAYPNATLVFAADNDWETALRIGSNPGVIAATKAAALVGGKVVIPADLQPGQTDFNDVHVAHDLLAVKVQFTVQLTPEAGVVDVGAMVNASKNTPIKPPVLKLVSTPQPASAKPAEGARADWFNSLRRNDKNQILPTLSNVFDILRYDCAWQGVIGFDEFGEQVVKIKPPTTQQAQVGKWLDRDDLFTAIWLERTYGVTVKDDLVAKASAAVADVNRFHTVRDYLTALTWDGQPRLASWLQVYLGAEANDYRALAGTKWLVAAIARVFNPGCKADNVLILEGRQGLMKSTALKVLGGDWFTDSPFKLGDKDGYILMRGKWLIELSELDSFNKADSSQAKMFFAGSVDSYRAPYGRRAEDVRRQCVFAGSVNHRQYLKDETGNRRYWPVACTQIDLEALRADRDQLWAEAVHLYRNGTRWWVQEDERDLFEWEQEQRREVDVWESLIEDYIKFNGSEQLTMNEVMSSILKIEISKMTKADQRRVGNCMAAIGWEKKRETKRGNRSYYYVRIVDVEGEAVALNSSTGAGRVPGEDDEEF